jgi:hypothetical protein
LDQIGNLQFIEVGCKSCRKQEFNSYTAKGVVL